MTLIKAAELRAAWILEHGTAEDALKFLEGMQYLEKLVGGPE